MARNMTSTPFNVGLNENTRVSSRVLRPPGGGHTDIFSGEPEPPRRTRRHDQSSFSVQGEEPEKPTNGTAAHPQNGQDAPQMISEPAVPQQTVPDAPQASPIESPKKTEIKFEPAKTEAPKRVRVPPGGFSSGLW